MKITKKDLEPGDIVLVADPKGDGWILSGCDNLFEVLPKRTNARKVQYSKEDFVAAKAFFGPCADHGRNIIPYWIDLDWITEVFRR